MDPLSALRDFTVRGELDKISQSSDEIRFAGDYSFPPTVETAFRSKQGNLYTLETLLHFILNHHLKHTDYLQSARSRRVPAVTLPDRKPLLDYLTGKISSSESIIQFLPSAPAATAADVEEYRPDDPSLPAFADPTIDAEIAGGAAVGVPLPEPDLDINYVSMIRAMERPLKDRESLLDCRNRNFLELLTASTKREEERQRVESQQRKDGIVAKTRLTSSNPHHRGDETPKPKMSLSVGKIGEGVPIILVPSAFQTLITMYNVKEFLEDGVFVPTDVKVKSMRGGAAAKPECVTVQKKLGSRDRLVTAYEVRDKTSSFKDEEWDRVVAVFVLGKEWQFKEWRSKDPVEIFNKVIGFFVRFEDDSVESVKTVKQWNVKIISISKNKRHQDRTAALEVWDRLEAFMRSRTRT